MKFLKASAFLLCICLFVGGCTNYIVSVPPPTLSATEMVAGPSPLAVGFVIDDELRNYQVVERPWADVTYTFQLGQSLGKTIEVTAQHAFARAVPLKAESPWETMRKEKLDRLIVVSLENAVVDTKSVGTFGRRGVANIRVTLRARVYDPSQKLIDEKILLGEGTSNQPLSAWGNAEKDTFTPGVEAALQDASRKLFRYFSQLKE